MSATSKPPTTHRNYTYRLKVRRRQHVALDRLLEQQRLLYNAALQERIDAFAKARKSISYVDQCKSLTAIRADDAEYAVLPLCLSRGTLKKLDLAFQAFFRRVKAGQAPGFPRFRPMSRWDSISFNEAIGIRISAQGWVTFNGVPGKLRLFQHRAFPVGSVPRSVVLRKTALGWTISFLLAVPLDRAEHWLPVEDNEKPDIGIDLGIASFAVTSDGEAIEGLHAGRTGSAAKRRLQRSLARAQRGSARRRRVKARLAKYSAREANQRSDRAHQLSSDLAKRFRCIAVEKLQIANMSRSAKGSAESPGSNVDQKAGLNRAILDQGWSRFIFQLAYKAESAGGRVVEINPNHTSQLCSSCGALVPKTLSERTHRCVCGLVMDRDHNAARNILFRADREGKLPARLQPSGFSTAVPRTIPINESTSTGQSGAFGQP